MLESGSLGIYRINTLRTKTAVYQIKAEKMKQLESESYSESQSAS